MINIIEAAKLRYFSDRKSADGEKAFCKLYFESNNIKLNQDVIIKVSFQMKHGNNFTLKEEYDG